MPYPWEAPAIPGRRRNPWEEDDPATLPEGAEEDQSSGFLTLPNVLRIGFGVGGGILGSVIPGAGTAAGAAIGGGAGSMLGEGLAELLEVRRGQRDRVNPLQIGMQGALGAVPMGKLGTVATGAAKGGLLGGGSVVGTSLAEPGISHLWKDLTGTGSRSLDEILDDEPAHGISEHLPSLPDVGRGVLFGGVFGGATSGILSRFARPAGGGQTPAAAAAGGPRRPPPMEPPTGSPYRSAVSPRFTSFEPPPVTFPDPGEMAMAYQPTLPGAIQPGGRRMGGWDQAGQPPPPGGYPIRDTPPPPTEFGRPDVNPSLSRPLLPSGLDVESAAIRQTEGPFPWELADDLQEPPGPLTRPEGPFEPLSRPLVPSGLDANPPAIAQTDGAYPWMQEEAPEPPAPLTRPPGPFEPLTRPLVPSGLDAAPPAITQTDGAYPWMQAEAPEPPAPAVPKNNFEPPAAAPPAPASLDGLRQSLGRDRAEEVLQAWRDDRATVSDQSRSRGGGEARGGSFDEFTRWLHSPDAERISGSPEWKGLMDDARRAVPGQRDPLAFLTPEPPAPPADALTRLQQTVEDAQQARPEDLMADLAADSNVDPLTQLQTRRGWERAGTQPGTVTGRLDLDNFKALNDQVGHGAGDRALAAAGRALQKFSRRRGDVVARLGGDEFGLKLEAPGPNGSIQQLRDQVEKAVEDAIYAEVPELRGRDFRVGASLGFGADEAAADAAAIARKAERGVSKPRQPVITASAPPSGPRPPQGFEQLDPATIKTDPKTYQFKGGADAEGVTDRLAAVESWDPIAGQATPVIVHRRANGDQFIVDGHQRLALAKRLQSHGRTVPPLNAIVLDEAAGVTPGQARRIGAMLNLQQGTGTATDIAKVLREKALSSAERARIPKDQTSGAKLRMGEDLAKLGDDAFLRVVNGQVHQTPARNEAFGAIVGRLVSDPNEQVSALQQLAKAAPENAYQAEQFVKATLAAGFERGVQTNLFGTSEVAHSLAEPIARVMAAARRTLQSDRSSLGNAIRNEERLVSRGNTLNREANQAGFEQAGALDRLLDSYGHTAGPVREELKRVAAAVQRGELTPAQAASRVLDAVERERTNLGVGAGDPPGGPGAPGVRSAVRPDDAPGGPPQAEAPPVEAPPPVEPPPAPVPEIPELSAATPDEVPTILKELADTLNVDNKPFDMPFSLAQEASGEQAAAATRQAGIFDASVEESAAGSRKVGRGDYGEPPQATRPPLTLDQALGMSEDDLQAHLQSSQPSADLPPALREAAGLEAIETRHEVRNPGKAGQIAASMKRVGWKGRPLLVVKEGDKEVAWTGTHRLEAAKQAGLKPGDIPKVTVDAAALRAAGYDVAELTKLGKKARIEALRKSGQNRAAELLEEERAAKQGRERNAGTNPRAQGTNPRAVKQTTADVDRLLDEGKVDEAERLLGQQIEGRLKAAFKHGTGKPGTGGDSGSTLVGGMMPFDPETFAKLLRKHPESAWRATTTAIGGATGWMLDEDHPGRGFILGALAGAGTARLPRLINALTRAEVRVGKPGAAGVQAVRRARDDSKDLGLFELVGGLPERTIPKQFEKARPAFERFVKALHEEHARTKQIIPQKRVQALRDRYVTPVITQIRKDAKLAADAKHVYKAKYITAFANRLAGHQTTGQRVVQALSKGKLPGDFIERRLAGMTYYTGTGFGVDTALQNMTQPLLATAHVPAKWIAKAYKDLATSPAAKRMVEGALIPLEKPADAIETTLGPFALKLHKAWDKYVDPQRALRWTDNKNRQVVYYAARTYAESRGLGTSEADTWARQVMRKTQAEPGALGTNPFHAGPVLGSLRPFTKFPTVMTEHVLDVLKQASHGENLGGAARLAAGIGGLVMLGKATGVDLEDLLVSGGRPLGLDITHPARSIERVATGMATPVTRAGFDLLSHIQGDADHDISEDAAALAIPRYPRKLYEGIRDLASGEDLHVKRGAGGKVRDIATPAETVMNLLGLRSTRQTDRRHALADFYEEASAHKETYETGRRRAYEDLSRAIDAGDEEAVGDAIRRIGSVQAVRQFMRERRLLPEERFFKTLPPKVRQELQGALDETRDLAAGAAGRTP